MSNYEIELQVQGSPSGELTQQVDGEPGGGSVSAREAEAWARGTRAGTAVSSDDPTYHNNSKYYAEQAHDAAESASAAYGTNLLAPTFDASQAYPAGQHVIHDGGYYVLPEGHTEGDTWAETSKTQQTVGGEVTGLKSAIKDVESKTKTSPNIFSGIGYTNKTYIKTRTVGGTVGYATSTSLKTYKKTVKVKAGIDYTLSFTTTETRTSHIVLLDDNDIVLQAINYSQSAGSVNFKPAVDGWMSFDINLNASNIMIQEGLYRINTYSQYDNKTYGIRNNKADSRVPTYEEHEVIKNLLNTSENIFDPSNLVNGKYIYGSTPGYTIRLETSSTAKVYKKVAKLKANTDYTLTFKSNATTGSNGKLALCDENNIVLKFISYEITERELHIKHTSDCCLYAQFYEDAYDISLVVGSVGQEEYSAMDRNTYGISANFERKKVPTYNQYLSAFPSNTVKTIAHRGNDIDAPQCTAPAYIMARKNGLRIAENDVYNSSDNLFVMWHDPTLYRLGNIYDISGYMMYMDGSNNPYWYDSANTQLYTYEEGEYVESSVDISTLTRTNGSNYSVTDFPYAVLKRMDFGRYKGSKFIGTQILSFEEWVLLCKQLGMELYIDHKTNLNSTMIASLASVLKKYGMLDKASWIVNSSQATAVRSNDPNARLIVLSNPTSEGITAWSSYVGTGRGIAFDGPASSLTQAAVQLGLETGFEVGTYYVDFDDDEATALARIRNYVEMGITEITTDKYSVEWAYEYLLEQY